MMTLYELDKYVRLQRAHRANDSVSRGAPAAGGKNPPPLPKKITNKAMSARTRSRALATLTGKRSLALTRPLDFTIPGLVPPLRQPSRMACWATTYTMMAGWRDQRSDPIETVLARVGQRWVDTFRADTGTSAEQEAEFYAAAGLVAEPLGNPTPEGWEGLLRQYGPLTVIVDVDPSDARAMHSLIVAGISGDGTADGTTLTIVDPARGDKRPVRFRDFVGQYEQGVTRRTRSGRFNQIIHWPKDVRFSGARGLGARAFTGKPPAAPAPAPAPATAQPWSHYFHFRKGSRFEVDGPLSYNGSGEVLERTGDYLKFTMKMPAVSIFGNDIPRADMVLEATYKKEGKGNLVRATINGVAMEDPDAEIVSKGTKRTIKPNFSGFTGPLPEWITVTPNGSDEIDLDMKIDGREVDFDLNLTSGSSGLALGIEPWSRSFPFPAGTAYLVDGPLSYNGKGRVLERTDTTLKFEMNMPESSIAPKLDLIVGLAYAKEGAGNRLDLTVNGTAHSDPNASITTNSSDHRRTIVHAITVPGAKLGRISFAPEGSNTIDLRVVVDGKEREFDLNKVAGAQGLVGELAISSTRSAGLAEVSAFAARTTASRWKLSRATVASRLVQLINDPNLVDQGSLNLCGPAAFFHVYIARDPRGFAKYAADLFETGTGMIGTLRVRPGDDLVLNDYARIVPRMASVTPQAEWMCLGALRDSENATLDFEGDPSENVAGMTTPGELASWMQKSGVYTRVADEGNWVREKGTAHALALSPAPNRDILMLINARIITAPAGKKKVVDAFPNHFIQLLSPVTRTAAGIEFDYWTWGLPPAHAVVSAAAFEDNYYGAVTGEV